MHGRRARDSSQSALVASRGGFYPGTYSVRYPWIAAVVVDRVVRACLDDQSACPAAVEHSCIHSRNSRQYFSRHGSRNLRYTGARAYARAPPGSRPSRAGTGGSSSRRARARACKYICTARRRSSHSRGDLRQSSHSQSQSSTHTDSTRMRPHVPQSARSPFPPQCHAQPQAHGVRG